MNHVTSAFFHQISANFAKDTDIDSFNFFKVFKKLFNENSFNFDDCKIGYSRTFFKKRCFEIKIMTL